MIDMPINLESEPSGFYRGTAATIAEGCKSFEGGNMAKILKCGDVVPGCNEEITGDSEHDVLRKAAEHAKTAHHMDSIPPEVLSKMKGAIQDEGGARTQKAGSSS